MENNIFCMLLNKDIDLGLCIETLAVDGQMLKKSSAPEIEQYTV